MRILYQFPISHYCEKTRWNLDAKGLTYRPVNLIPALHRITTYRLAGATTLPLLRDGRDRVADSTGIALFLDQRYPERPLIPGNETLRREVLDLDTDFNRAGVHVRRWLYGQMLDSPDLAQLMFGDYYTAPVAAVGQRMAPLLRKGLRSLYRVTPSAVERSYGKMEAALDQLGRRVKGDGDYLVGDAFSLADISAASMFAPLLQVPGTPWENLGRFADVLVTERDAARQHPAGQWILNLYGTMRSPGSVQPR